MGTACQGHWDSRNRVSRDTGTHQEHGDSIRDMMLWQGQSVRDTGPASGTWGQQVRDTGSAATVSRDTGTHQGQCQGQEDTGHSPPQSLPVPQSHPGVTDLGAVGVDGAGPIHLSQLALHVSKAQAQLPCSIITQHLGTGTWLTWAHLCPSLTPQCLPGTPSPCCDPSPV